MASRQNTQNYKNKDKYNNRTNRNNHNNHNNHNKNSQQYARQQGDTTQSHGPVPTQSEMRDYLIEKLQQNKFVEVNTKEITNERGVLYEIDVKNHGLYRIGNSTFYSMKLHTVSHKSRVIFIRIIFNDNEGRNADMRVNADAIIQIFRELAPDTIDTISINDVDDSKGTKHLAVIASTVKGASLNYTYERALQFVHVIDEKYGSPSDSANTNNANLVSPDLTTNQIDAEEALLKEKLNALQKLKQSRKSNTNSQSVANGITANSPNANGPTYASATATSTNSAETSNEPIEEISGPDTPRSRPTSPSKISITIEGKTKVIKRK
jgi:hypothetical protein